MHRGTQVTQQLQLYQMHLLILPIFSLFRMLEKNTFCLKWKKNGTVLILRKSEIFDFDFDHLKITDASTES